MHPQLEKYKQEFMALQMRERVLIASGAILILLTAIYLLAFAPLNKAVSDANARVAKKQADLAWMQSVAPQVSAAGNAAAPVSTNESIVVLIANSANQSGVGNALTGQTPDGANGVRVRLEGADFDALVLWMGRLQQQYGISVENASIDRAAKPGQVNANLMFTRNAPA
jgi:general secretion pathway protein M